ncbi:uncharacterized protein CcaverHIS019_0309530 [Cutaneotrichosporon cavernicola]|uniref:Uncharacterized protein n=1 Tax=Cutaneotrichosporon cavernicola TaxID=279322 RepID=A0AA48IH47_9TREE|nr:uncharacterized protein CcaverHIS019_0309530 [Cutaneotrichosporon cavernicola]BEI90883.1 hypothetical protein CcaverHIS019_0309530 [Cutaneotrichosporon cavernicola]BEI98662.1 hypothetical protein CcaverHIS631_0309610 [Cutaneotrichosporon cavernicola]BEJ06432.1 hypothetical protein CcaverHIS641_0309540 [Cutaneotrichosporon cavernicola]
MAPPGFWLDGASFPHIVDTILLFSEHSSLVRWRCVSSSVRAQVDRVLCDRLAIRDFGTDNVPTHGVRFYTQVDEDQVRKPVFVFYEHSDDILDKWTPPLIKTAAYVSRAAEWCLEACPGVRILDLNGDVKEELAPLIQGLANVKVLRIASSAPFALLEGPPITVPHLFAATSLSGLYYDEFPSCLNVPFLPPTFESLTLYVSITVWRTSHAATVRALVLGAALRSVTVVLVGFVTRYVIESEPRHSDSFGVPSDLIEGVIPHLDTVRLTLVNIKDDFGPGFNLIPSYPETLEQILEAFSFDWWSSIRQQYILDFIRSVLKTKFLRKMTRAIRHQAAEEGWAEEKTERAINNVRVLDHAAWKAEVNDGVLTSWNPTGDPNVSDSVVRI